MHYYRPLTQPVPVKPYHNLIVTVPNDIWSIAVAQAFFKAYCKTVKYNGMLAYSVLTIKTPSEIQDEIVGASVEYV